MENQRKYTTWEEKEKLEVYGVGNWWIYEELYHVILKQVL